MRESTRLDFAKGDMDIDDDSDDSSQIETLDQFREKWHKELNTTKCNQKQLTKNTTGHKNANDDDGKAKDHQVNTHGSPIQNY